MEVANSSIAATGRLRFCSWPLSFYSQSEDWFSIATARASHAAQLLAIGPAVFFLTKCIQLFVMIGQLTCILLDCGYCRQFGLRGPAVLLPRRDNPFLRFASSTTTATFDNRLWIKPLGVAAAAHEVERRQVALHRNTCGHERFLLNVRHGLNAKQSMTIGQRYKSHSSATC